MNHNVTVICITRPWSMGAVVCTGCARSTIIVSWVKFMVCMRMHAPISTKLCMTMRVVEDVFEDIFMV